MPSFSFIHGNPAGQPYWLSCKPHGHSRTDPTPSPLWLSLCRTLAESYNKGFSFFPSVGRLRKRTLRSQGDLPTVEWAGTGDPVDCAQCGKLPCLESAVSPLYQQLQMCLSEPSQWQGETITEHCWHAHLSQVNLDLGLEQ